MQSNRTLEIWVGIFVALGFAAILMLSMKVSHFGDLFAEQGYSVTAKFDNIGGLKAKSPVKMSGVRIGRIADIRYDDDNYQAIVTMQIDPQYDKIPYDSSTAIYTAGLLGEQYIGLTAGTGLDDWDDEEDEDLDESSDEDLDANDSSADAPEVKYYLKDGDQLNQGLTQSAIILEQLIGQFIYNMAAKDSGSK
ncbi:MAG: outer membrane lipid asymmetry maintenance protein MlaD [Candidatus Parabeggiatoa sp. nov. 3]|jgi:phospholipid/cholesterol/gamma-HCH transport system substrate-binding protein|nr:MAG: outer membrane lipid asymmetry maintenance protein MlaD [Gammaproteobacteria bacterium]RKZ66008.1 MAG: outer membrane lipid asymmetry maintenance protein MlaD [Gammaproteobacteria bacterium]RKZ85713.1 MAG: outer membrane lipid asymmetry maintenance protein MlaD [Gammaproteobacteria bacterium]